jgi:hypothetical protein
MSLLLGLLLAAAPAAAAVPTDDSDPVDLARWYVHGKCLVAAAPAEAEQMLAVRPGSRTMFMAFLRADGRAKCFNEAPGPKAKLHHNAARGAIVEALLLRDFSAVGVARSWHHAVTFRDTLEKPAPAEAGDGRGHAYLALTECAVRIDPERSFAVFATPPGGSAETEAMRLLIPALSQCITPGEAVPLRPPVLRSYLAEAAYRVSVDKVEGAGK